MNDNNDKTSLVAHCVTHHFACDCREAIMAESMQTHRRVIDWSNQSEEGLRLRCGELSAQEIRTIRAVLNALLFKNTPADPPQNAQGEAQHPTR